MFEKTKRMLRVQHALNSLSHDDEDGSYASSPESTSDIDYDEHFDPFVFDDDR